MSGTLCTVVFAFVVTVAMSSADVHHEEIGVRRNSKGTLSVGTNGRVHVANGRNTRGTPSVGAADDQTNELEPGAVFAVMVQSPDHYGDKKKQNMAGDAARFLCSARLLGSTTPFHLIYGGGADEGQLAVLRALGWHVEDHTGDMDFWKSNYKPLYNESDARKQRRRWRTDHNPNFVQKRKDGWCTYFKFHAWQATSYKHVLLSDLDVKFEKKPDDMFTSIDSHVTLLANPEKSYRWYYEGLNTHVTILKPSNKTFDQLVKKAHTGDYLPFTNTEQDIIEDLFPPSKGHSKYMNALIQHRHGSNAFPECTTEWANAVLQSKSPSCTDMFKLCEKE